MSNTPESLEHFISIATSAFGSDTSAPFSQAQESKAEVDKWQKVATEVSEADDKNSTNLIESLNSHLVLRTYFVEHTFTPADVAIYIGLMMSDFWDGIIETNKRIKYKHLVRWFNYCKSYVQFSETVKLLPPKTKKSHVTATFEPLAGAVEGKVITRFPPEPSGFLHIGHAKAAFMNDYYAKRYNGKLIIRFDDTNPRKEKEEFEEAILSDLKTLNIVPDTTSHTSDYFQQIMDKAEELIKTGKAFCDPTPAAEVSSLRDQLLPSPFRDTSVEENLKIWNSMKSGAEESHKYSLRAKIDYKSPNGTMRDPVIYRYVDLPHNRTGDKFKIYPIYNFACPVVDSLEGVTHALRSNEYHDSIDQYYWFIDNTPGLNKVVIKDFSRVNFTYTLLSKRKLQKLVDMGVVQNWDDPRFPTIQGVTRRGLTITALKKIHIQSRRFTTNSADGYTQFMVREQRSY